jgi:hypothetical protein
MRVLGTAGLYLPLAGLAGLALGVSGCAGTVASASATASKAAVPVVVDQSLHSFEDPATRERVEQIMASPEMQKAMGDMARGAAAGMLDTKTEAELTRALSVAVRHATVEAIDAASAEMPRTLGPAIRTSLVDSLNSNDVRSGVSGVVSDATRSALVSSHDIIADLRQKGEIGGALDHMVDRLEKVVIASIAGTFALGVLLGVVGTAVALRRRRESAGGGTGPGVRLDRTPTHAT